MKRTSIKIVGASGQGIDSTGEILARALKRSGYCVFGYREYPSLIKGGHASYQLDIAATLIQSTETSVDALITLNHHGLETNLTDIKAGGMVLHSTPHWKFGQKEQEQIQKHGLTVLELPIEQTLQKLEAKPILSNVLLAAFMWAALKQDQEVLKVMVKERFAKKKDLLDLNMRCIEAGMAMHGEMKAPHITLPKPKSAWKKQLLITGSKAMGLGAIHAGMRVYAGYPMTPSSPLLTYIASVQNEMGLTLKQAEDEITAAQMASGAMFAGTRALTATSGGGFDLMSETVSLNAIIENPTVFVLAQRPGPATGLPTWTGQGDLLMAVNTAHGEFARSVVAVSDSADAFSLMGDAFNIAEEFQISVIVLTDKQIAEALYTQVPYDMKVGTISRGKLITKQSDLAKCTSGDRYDPNAEDGISPRWLPGSEAATFAAQGDEHSGDGTVDESSENAHAQMRKRMRKLEALRSKTPEPLLTVRGALETENDIPLDVLLVGWGSTKSVVLDALSELENDKKFSHRIGYLHYTHLWPLKTSRITALASKAKRIVLVEGNYAGQLGVLLRQECGLEIREKILKYDGRPFFVDELKRAIEEQCASLPSPQ